MTQDKITIKLPASVLTKEQKKVFSKAITYCGKPATIKAEVRYDDHCGNGHNSFSITGEIWLKGKTRDCETCGCIHDEIAKHFSELAPLIKWHLTNSDGPMHYVANTVYHATQHGPKSAWVFHEDVKNGIKRHCVKYCDIAEAQEICKTHGYTMEMDPKTAKEANLDHARSSAVWPDATQEQLLDKAVLMNRLPALMAEFKIAVESLGFTY
jgi:hypothetical protein